MDLYPYQKIGADWLKCRSKALLYDDPGLGKTRQAIAAWPLDVSGVVVCPASVKQVWAQEIAKVRPDIQPFVISGRNKFTLPKNPKEVVIVNYDILPDFPLSFNVIRKTHLVLDEVHACKSTQSLRSKRVKLLRSIVVASGGNVHGLSGTPILSKPEDLWGILYCLGLEKDAFGNYNNFLRVFAGRRIEFGKRFSKIVWGTPLPESTHCIARVALGRKREMVLPDLPTKTYETYLVEINDTSALDQLGTKDIYEFLEQPGALSSTREVICNEKTLSAIPYITELSKSEPLVIFTTHKRSAEAIASSFGTVPITGDTNPGARVSLINDFQSGKTDIIVGTVLAMGVGVTLTRSHHVVFINRDWTPALNKQAEDRVCRIGQDKGVLVTDILVNHPVEDIVYKVLMRKQGIIDGSVEKARQ